MSHFLKIFLFRLFTGINNISIHEIDIFAKTCVYSRVSFYYRISRACTFENREQKESHIFYMNNRNCMIHSV